MIYLLSIAGGPTVMSKVIPFDVVIRVVSRMTHFIFLRAELRALKGPWGNMDRSAGASWTAHQILPSSVGVRMSVGPLTKDAAIHTSLGQRRIGAETSW